MDSSSGNLSSQGEGTSGPLYPQEWVEVQDMLKRKLVLEDDFTWTISPQDSCLDQVREVERLQYIGGVDVSFVKEDPSLACGALVILDASTLNVVHEEFEVVRLKVPYAPGFLAFREAPIVLRILDKMKQNAHPLFPQLLMVDGNGILHPRVMEDEDELIATALVNEFNQQEKMEELFEDNHEAALQLEGLIRESLPKSEQISPEDLIWADSCLVADLALLDESWVSLKEALLDSITELAVSYEENNAVGLDDGVTGNSEQMQVDGKVEERIEIANNGEDAAGVRAQNEGIPYDHNDDGRKEIESKESIFRVWDIRGEEEENELIDELKKAVQVLKVVEEEKDEFIPQLKRAVAESDLRDEVELPSGEPSIYVGEELDELISSLGDLSLRPSSKCGF